MDDGRRGSFGGVAGRVLLEAMSAGSFLTGLALVIPFAVLTLLLAKGGSSDLASIGGQILATLALARFALNGRAGQWRGTVFSKYGGGNLDMVVVSVRFALLSAVWLIPIYLFGFRPDQSAGAFGMLAFGMGGGKTLALAAVYLACIALSPPIFLIVSVSAPHAAAIFSPSHWKTLFGGRTGDLFLIYALYLGGITMATIILLPALAILASIGMKVALFFGACGMVFVVGLAVTALGRLCGFFTAAVEMESDDSGERILGLITPTIGRDPSSPQRETIRSQREHSRVQLRNAGPAASAKANPHDLLGLVENAVRLFETDPTRAIGDLEEFEKREGSNPVVLSALSRLKLQSGEETEAVELARRAISYSLHVGAQKPAAETFRAFSDRIDQLDLGSEEILRIAGTLRSLDDLDAAADAYCWLVQRNEGGSDPVKGLVQVAESYMQRRNPSRALVCYDFLLQECPESPLMDYVREEREEAARKQAREA